ncbi:UvrD-helicase domain-containing protein [Listeria booriae]|uniref:UvrD-helicase domain-containing protein n=1 Tax=Listeria booriae TaxID=1552123 RepID=UPI0016295247|nr:UvrD-helicase domain-containing protein [Listeria booriae]MBC1811258.1 UvrD-helicase domain-containing protein [Listeria booriae]MBC1897007.1 UvrD-helicase domain-containing protein [Listeria booriae]MBC2367385.1 UvrD-helicase domain-containing protein [Listeria booriae]
MKNTFLMAAAGAGKTTFIVKEAIKCTDAVLITTFTEENEAEIKNKFIELHNGTIPSHVTIRSWFSFLIEHGARPYQGKLTNKKINGLLLVNEKSGVKYRGGKFPVYYKEADNLERHYFSNDFQIYSDKLAKFVIRCNEKSNGFVIERISTLFQHIFIDEVQDMAGYDLEIIKLLFKSEAKVKIAGDPRQVTYHTHFADKYKKYSKGEIRRFIEIECKSIQYHIDEKTLNGSWRNNQVICDFANSLFPEYPQCTTLQHEVTQHDGVYLVREKDVERYLKEFSPTQLRFSRAKKVNLDYEVKNFGESKGATRDRVLIYPTKKITDWLFDNSRLDNFEIKCKFYVAITRAKHSVAIVCNNNVETDKLPIYQ